MRMIIAFPYFVVNLNWKITAATDLKFLDTQKGAMLSAEVVSNYISKPW